MDDHDGLKYLNRLIKNQGLSNDQRYMIDTIINKKNNNNQNHMSIYKLVHKYYDSLWEFTFADLFTNYQNSLRTILSLKELNSDSWKNEIKKLLNFVLPENYLFTVRGDEGLDTSLKEEIKKELLRLPKLPLSEINELDDNNDNLGALLENVQSDVKKGNRATFKLMQDLEMKLIELGEKNKSDDQEQNGLKGQFEKKVNQMRDLALSMFDQLFRIHQAALQMDNPVMATEIEKILEQSLETLSDYGLEVIEVMGKMIDGTTMISLGNVSREQYAPELEKYHVYSIYQQGFRDKETKEVIRKAKVITVD